MALAYRVLSDDEKRERYDRTGKVEDEPDNTLSLVMNVINTKIDDLLQMPDVHTLPLIELCREAIQKDMRQAKRQKDAAGEVSLRLAKTRKKLRFKGKGQNLLDRAMEARQKQVEQATAGMTEKIGILERAIAMLADYDFELERPPTGIRPTGGIFWAPGGGQ